jgi:hypothetical protein
MWMRDSAGSHYDVIGNLFLVTSATGIYFRPQHIGWAGLYFGVESARTRAPNLLEETEKQNHEPWIGSISRQNRAAIEQDDQRCREALGPGRVAATGTY